MSQQSRLPMSFIEVDYLEPHRRRRQEIRTAHPEVDQFSGPWAPTFFFILALVVLQTMAAIVLSKTHWLVLILSSYVFGAVLNHALFVLIHEGTHNLVFKKTTWNKWVSIFANLPIGFPMAISFRKYHMLHHKHQGHLDWDADLPTPREVRVVGRKAILKGGWLFLFMFIEGLLRPSHLKKVEFFDRWTLFNWLFQVAFLAVLGWFFGFVAIAYFLLSTLFSVGLHPLGARWIQEHFVVKDQQETYSYYGPANWVSFNVGYHNEHHDFITVPWRNLPLLRKAAPEYYDTLHYHTSYTQLLKRFLFDPELNLSSRVIRNVKSEV